MSNASVSAKRIAQELDWDHEQLCGFAVNHDRDFLKSGVNKRRSMRWFHKQKHQNPARPAKTILSTFALEAALLGNIFKTPKARAN